MSLCALDYDCQTLAYADANRSEGVALVFGLQLSSQLADDSCP
jgi:hypothetical protein